MQTYKMESFVTNVKGFFNYQLMLQSSLPCMFAGVLDRPLAISFLFYVKFHWAWCQHKLEVKNNFKYIQI